MTVRTFIRSRFRNVKAACEALGVTQEQTSHVRTDEERAELLARHIGVPDMDPAAEERRKTWIANNQDFQRRLLIHKIIKSDPQVARFEEALALRIANAESSIADAITHLQSRPEQPGSAYALHLLDQAQKQLAACETVTKRPQLSRGRSMSRR